MNHTQLYLNDQLADVSDDSPIALTFQINDLSEVKNQQGNTSNQFKLPLTQNNRIILGFPDDTGLTDTVSSVQIPYTQLSARIIQNGIEILPNAIAEINEVDDDTASITILSGNVDFFGALGGQIADMGDITSRWSNYGTNLPWKPFDHTWNLQNAAYSQTHTEQDGWIYPIIDYGKISLSDYSSINVHNLRPGFFIKKAIDILVQSTGYTATGSLLADPLYPLLIAQFSNSSFEHGIYYQNAANELVSLQLGAALPVDHPSAQVPSNGMGNISWGIITANWQNQFVPGQGFVAAETVTVLITVNIPHIRLQGRVTGTTPSYVDIIMWLKTPGLSDEPLTQFGFEFASGQYVKLSGSGGDIVGYQDFYNTSFSATTTLAAGQGIYIGYEFQGSTPSSFIMDGSATWTIAAQNGTVQFGQTVQCERILPDMSQTDFLKDTFQRFGIMCQTDVYNKTINFASLRDIIANIPVANDWTAKCIDQGKQINYRLGSYAQVNYMEYQTDPNILPLKFGWDQLAINDQILSSVPSDLIVSKFGPSFNRPFYGGTIAQIAMMSPQSDTNDFTISVAPRLLVDQKIDLRNCNNVTVNFTDGTNTIAVNDIISVPYFYKPDGQYNLCWCDMPGIIPGQSLPGLRTKYYSDLQKVLQNTKIIVRYFLLTPRDIAELNLLIPVYLQQHNAYFYINKIDSWRKGQPCKVELVRIG